MMYGLAAVDRHRHIDFDEAGRCFEYETGTGAITLCDVGTDGELLTVGTREQIERIADRLMDEYPGEWRAVPLPWSGGFVERG
jgi:hypothetical protein